MALSIVGIILSLILLMYLAYRGIAVIWLAPILALVAVLFSTGTPVMASYTEVFMNNFSGYVKAYFPVFLMGAIFGKIMEESGSAKTISHFFTEKLGKKNALLAIVLSVSVLTYGGVSMFVVAFAVYPIAAELFRENDIPKRLIPGTIALGSFTFTMTALPGSPQIQNTIPMPFFGTTAYAAPILGLIGGTVMFVGGMMWLTRREKAARAAGEGYGDHHDNIKQFDEGVNLPSLPAALTPILIVLVLNFVIGNILYSGITADYLKDYGTTFTKVKGIWSLLIALLASIIAGAILFRKQLGSLKDTVNKGAFGALLPIINTASEVGYGNVIKSLAAFTVIQAAVLGIPGTPFISLAVSSSAMAGITGSASGGMSIALSALGDVYMQKAALLNINPEAFHRIAAMACGGLDSLPHNGAVITLLGITGLTHKQSYKDIGMVTVVIPIIATAIAIVFATMGVV